ncbi:Intermediate filament protein [Agyrium rufum]|nr:Intermediate filament protein [Agyrium rufum]
MALNRRDIAISALAAFIAWGFLTHWAPILRYLGYAFVAGVLVTVGLVIAIGVLTVKSRNGDNPERSGGSAAAQTAAFITPQAWEEEKRWLADSQEYTPRSLFPSSLKVSRDIDGLFNLILRDFVSSWYNNITRSPHFRDEVDRAIRVALNTIRSRIESVDIVEVAISRFFPIITNHLHDFDEAEHAVRGKKLNRNVTESEELDLAIATKYKDGKLHPAASLAYADTKIVQQEYLRKLVVRLMPEILPESTLKSRAVSVLIKEILSCAVLTPAMQLLSDPDTWNQIMEAYGQTMLQDRKTVRKLRAALDEHASPAPKLSKMLHFPKLSPQDDERKFERFIRAIRQCQNLSDARRFRNEVASQLKRESMLEGQDHVYLRRLETGKRMLDQRVGKLSAVGGGTRPTIPQPDFGNGKATSKAQQNISVVDMMHDSSGLSYFMEFMDRHRLMTLIQFWIVVDGFRNPLEDDDAEYLEFVDSPPQWTESDRSDIAQITEAYFPKPELRIPEESREAVKQFLKSGRGATSSQYVRARSAVLRAQSATQQTLQEKYYPLFKNSDLYYKYLTSEDAGQKSLLKPNSRAIKPPSVPSIAESPTKPAPSRNASTVSIGAFDLKRNAASSHDLKTAFKSHDDILPQRSRRSFDVSSSSAPLFDDDIEPESYMTRSTHSADSDSLFSDQANGQEQAKIVEAMEAALTNIMTDEPQGRDSSEFTLDSPDQDSLFGRDSRRFQNVMEFKRDDNSTAEKGRERPNLASLGLVNTSSRIGVFTDDDLFGDEEKFLEDEHADPEEFSDKEIEDEIHQAAPGDLGLAEAITALTIDIEKLVAQESVVDTLTRKAELTNNVAELRILGKSRSSLQREIRRKELQRQQYIVQESDNSLYGRASIEITSIMVGKEDDGQEFALYVIEVRRRAIEQMPEASWAVARRYSEFHDLHTRLRHLYPAVRTLEFPRRRIVLKLQRDFLHKRRVSLERYLRELLHLPDVCSSRDLRAFLSQQAIISTEPSRNGEGEKRDIVSRIYNSVTDGMDEFLGNIPVLDQLSIAGQNLISAATTQYNNLPITPTTENPSSASGSMHTTTLTTAEAQAELEAFENKELEPFVKPICDIFLEIFELNRGQNWLRGRAVVVVLHQLLGGTVERKVRETFRSLTADSALLKYLATIKTSLWPDGEAGKMREAKVRPAQEKAHARKEAKVMLGTLIPDLAGNVVGRANAQGASRRVWAVVNNARLDLHLAFVLLDEVVAVLFPPERGGRVVR